MSKDDPTDHALAAIASILDKPQASGAASPPSAHETAERPEVTLAEEILTSPQLPATPPPLPPEMDSSESYSRFGPGPLMAIRFKWTARRADNGDYFVDETIGDNPAPITVGPMTRDAAIKLVDERERHAHQRFEALRSEMAGGEIGGPSAFES